ncbi:MAG: glycosyltransferase [Planctomycetota bacterium]|jgi:glycosyltransferase involved in cell wall biosynthesis
MENPLVSVIIIVKNGERFLSSAIGSVLQQEYRPFELIVVDGRSTDKTPEIAQSYPDVRYIQQRETGVSDAYNLGINSVQGKLVAFLSHDDLWTLNKLTTQVEYMVQHPEILYTISKVKFFLEPGVVPPIGFKKELLEGTHVGRIMETLVAWKSVFEKVGKFNTKLSTAEDVDWYSRASDQQIPMAVIPKVLLHKRIHDRNISLNINENNQNLLDVLRQSVHRKKADNTSL